MKLSHSFDGVFPLRRRAQRVGEECANQAVQVEAPVEAVGEGAKIAAGVLAELEGLVRAADCGLQIAQDGVDPVELGHVARLALTDNDVGVGTAGVDHTGKAVQAVTEDIGAGRQVSTAARVPRSSTNVLPTWSISRSLVFSFSRTQSMKPLALPW